MNYLRVIFCLCLFFMTGFRAEADIYWESEQVLSGIPGKEDKRVLIRVFATQRYTRMDIGKHIMIADFKTMTGYALDASERIFLEMKMDSVGKIPEGLTEDIKVTPTDETKEIAGYTCRKYKVCFMDQEYEEWLSQEVDGYKDLREISDHLTVLVHENPLFQMGVIGRMDRLDGFPVQTVIPLEGGFSRITTLKKVIKKDLPESLFKVPKGYKPPY